MEFDLRVYCEVIFWSECVIQYHNDQNSFKLFNLEDSK